MPVWEFWIKYTLFRETNPDDTESLFKVGAPMINALCIPVLFCSMLLAVVQELLLSGQVGAIWSGLTMWVEPRKQEEHTRGITLVISHYWGHILVFYGP